MAWAYDAQSVSTGGSASTATWSHTCTGTDRVLYVAVSLDGSGAGGVGLTATYAGVSMTKIGESTAQQGLNHWRLVNPATGANNIVLTWTDPFVWAAAGLSLTGIDQTTPDSGTATVIAAATGTSITQNISSAAGNVVVDALSLNAGATGTTTPGAGQTTNAVESGAAAAATLCGLSYEDGGATVTMSWSWSSSSTRNAHSAISVNAAAGGAAFVAKPTRPILQAVPRANTW